MELFVVDRYDEEETEGHSESDEKLKLSRLLKKIESKKSLKKQKTECSVTNKLELPEESGNETLPVEKNLTESKGESEASEAEIDNFKEASQKEPAKEKNNVTSEFTILEDKNFIKKSKVKRVLPKWLANPTIISVNLQELHVKVKDMKELHKSLRKTLKKNGVKYFFPVQATVIPWLLESNKQAKLIFPRDVCVSAPTGSGKTLAFVLPIIQALMDYSIKAIRALIILPTQDLALQVFKAFQLYTKYTNLNVALATGKSKFCIEQKQLVYENVAFGYMNKVDILVCTAGRLVDHLKNTKGFSLKNLEFLVIDEADRVLDSVQNDWLYHLEKHILEEDLNPQTPNVLNLFTLKKKRPPQKLLFSATLSQDPEKLQKLSLFQPKLFTSVVEGKNQNDFLSDTFIGKFTIPKELTEKYIICSLDLKPLVLYEFIKIEKLTRTMIFTHSLETTHRLTVLLKSLFKDMKIEEISSNLETNRRYKLIKEFSQGQIDLLVCTDSLARGIDLNGVQCVISYSAPKHVKTYIHRVGRTARAGEKGLAVTFLHKSQFARFQQQIVETRNANLEEIKIFEENLELLAGEYRQALQDLKNTITTEVENELQKNKKVKRAKANRKRKRNED